MMPFSALLSLHRRLAFLPVAAAYLFFVRSWEMHLGSYQPLPECLPLKEHLSAAERRTWASAWRRLTWTSPRYLIVRIFVFAGLAVAFGSLDTRYFHEISPSDKAYFLLCEFFAAYWVSSTIVYSASKSAIRERILRQLKEPQGT
jgi:hypothetical protein